MTLVVARSISDEIRILCDSRVTDPEIIRSRPMTDMLKAVILRPDLCVCFAGNIHHAQASIDSLVSYCAGNTFDLEAVLANLMKRSEDSLALAENGVPSIDFIVATLQPCQAIYRIKDGMLERNLVAAWIGDYGAFSAFQEHFHTNQERSLDQGLFDNGGHRFRTVMKMTDSLRSVMSDGAFPTVGNFLISVTSKPAGGVGFTYLPSVIGDGFGSAGDGGYCYSILAPKAPGVGAVGVYFNQGRFGALMYPANSGKTIQYTNVDLECFILRVKEDFGVEFWKLGFDMFP